MKQKYRSCPKCGSTKTDGTEFQTEDYMTYHSVHTCKACGYKFMPAIRKMTSRKNRKMTEYGFSVPIVMAKKS